MGGGNIGANFIKKQKTKPKRKRTPTHCAADLMEFLIFFTTTSTKKNGSGATLGTLEVKKLKIP